MKTKFIIPVILISSFSSNLFGQTIQFDYDDNGNRTSRILITERIQSNSVSFPVKNTRSLITFSNNSEESIKAKETVTEEIKSEESEIKPIVYPNPTKGIIRIAVSNMPLQSKNELRIYDLNGNQLFITKDFGSSTEFDLSKYIDGIYILRMKIDDLLFDWKIIKKN